MPVPELDGTVIYKMTGSGNDFVMVDGRVDPAETWSRERVAAVCARGTGVGADGFVVVSPGATSGSVRFRYFNADGGRSEMCGNAALCAVWLSVFLELAPSGRVVLETDVGPQPGRCIEGQSELAEIELPSSAPLSSPDIDLKPGEQSMHLTRVGVPHLVVLVDDLPSVDIGRRGRELRSHTVLEPHGANVNFVGRDGTGWGMRTYERGVEAETLACGTGAVASAATLVASLGLALPISLRTTSGATLTVAGTVAQDGALTTPRLTGQARLVFRGVLGRLTLGALPSPSCG